MGFRSIVRSVLPVWSGFSHSLHILNEVPMSVREKFRYGIFVPWKPIITGSTLIRAAPRPAPRTWNLLLKPSEQAQSRLPLARLRFWGWYSPRRIRIHASQWRCTPSTSNSTSMWFRVLMPCYCYWTLQDIGHKFHYLWNVPKHSISLLLNNVLPVTLSSRGSWMFKCWEWRLIWVAKSVAPGK